MGKTGKNEEKRGKTRSAVDLVGWGNTQVTLPAKMTADVVSVRGHLDVSLLEVLFPPPNALLLTESMSHRLNTDETRMTAFPSSGFGGLLWTIGVPSVFHPWLYSRRQNESTVRAQQRLP